MKRLLALVCLVFFSLALPAEVLGGLNFKPGSEPDGFRGIRWGADISTLKDMECFGTADDGLSKFYIRSGDNLTIGDAQLNKIAYSFWNGKFYGVVIETSGYSNYLNLQEAVSEMFGIGTTIELYKKQFFVWDGAVTTMTLTYDTIGGEGLFVIYSKKGEQKRKLWKRQKAREGARGGF
jgi:hypothetical protein